MHIADILSSQSPTLSFEFFPPKSSEASEALYQTIGELEEFHPSFVSVTYGAGGPPANSPMTLLFGSKRRPRWIRFLT